MSQAVETSNLTSEEEQIFTAQVIPLLETRLLPAFVPRAATTLRNAIGQAKKRFGMPFGGLMPSPGQIGVAPLSGKDFNLTNTFTGFRLNYSTANAFTLAVSSVTTSRFTFLVILAIQDVEGVVRARAVKFTAGGVEHPVIWLPELRGSDRQFQEIEPFIISPLGVVSFDVFVGADTGFDEIAPWGFVVAQQNYLISKTFIA